MNDLFKKVMFWVAIATLVVASYKIGETVEGSFYQIEKVENTTPWYKPWAEPTYVITYVDGSATTITPK